MSINADKYIEVEEQASVSTPATGKGRFFFKDDGLPYTINDAGEEIQVGAGGAGSSKAINQSTHGFAVGDVIRYANQSGESGYVKSQADTAENADVIGVVTEVEDSNNFTVGYSGFITLAGKSFSAGSVYFLSDATAGLLTTTEPTDIGSVSKPVFIAVSATTGYFFNWRGSVIAGGSSGGSTITTDQVTGTSDINTASTTYVDMTDMSLTLDGAGTYIFDFYASIYIPNGSAYYTKAALDIDGVDVVEQAWGGYSIGGENPQGNQHCGIRWIADITTETTAKIQWKVSAGTTYQNASTNSSPRVFSYMKIA